ncbi:MAG: hypothetical protein ACLPPF_01890 [Rhodomicrobium sp.]
MASDSPIEHQLTKEVGAWQGPILPRHKRGKHLTPEEQFKRLQEAAKEHEIEERSPEIERVFEKRSKNGGTKKTTISKK